MTLRACDVTAPWCPRRWWCCVPFAEMTPFYERVCATLGWPVDETLLAKLKYVWLCKAGPQ